MQSDIDLAHNWRRAFFALFITILACTLTFAATGGPGVVFYAVGAIVILLLGVDLLIRARVERGDRESSSAARALPAAMAANDASGELRRGTR
jgi:hypothetical protein